MQRLKKSGKIRKVYALSLTGYSDKRQVIFCILTRKLLINLEDQLSANSLTTFQFKERIADTKRAKKEFEANLDKVFQVFQLRPTNFDQVMAEIGNLEKQMRELEIAISDKEAPLMVCESRMGVRQKRPNNELCRDPALYRMNTEALEIEANVQRSVTTIVYKLCIINFMLSRFLHFSSS